MSNSRYFWLNHLTPLDTVFTSPTYFTSFTTSIQAPNGWQWSSSTTTSDNGRKIAWHLGQTNWDIGHEEPMRKIIRRTRQGKTFDAGNLDSIYLYYAKQIMSKTSIPYRLLSQYIEYYEILHDDDKLDSIRWSAQGIVSMLKDYSHPDAPIPLSTPSIKNMYLKLLAVVYVIRKHYYPQFALPCGVRDLFVRAYRNAVKADELAKHA